MMWVQEFEEESDGLVSHALTSIFNSEDIAVHATKWDDTFKGPRKILPNGMQHSKSIKTPLTAYHQSL
jgi:hypothetical protein